MKKGFAAGVLIGIICVFSAVYAADDIIKIKSADYNDMFLLYNGEKIDLDGKNLVSVINEGESNQTNYMPLRAVLENLGYGVAWHYGVIIQDGVHRSHNSIGIYSEEYLESSNEWIKLQDMLDKLKYYPALEDMRLKFNYDKIAKAVKFSFALPRSDGWYCTTAVINNDENKIYLKKEDINNCFHFLAVPPIDNFTEQYIKKLKEIVSYDAVQKILEAQEGLKIYEDKIYFRYEDQADSRYDIIIYFNNKLQVFGNYDKNKFEIYYNAEFQGYIERAEGFYPQGAAILCMKKEDINYYLNKYGLKEID